MHWDGSPFMKCQFWALTRQTLDNLGLQNWKPGTHSFRMGATSTASVMGYVGEDIQHLGQWQSSFIRVMCVLAKFESHCCFWLLVGC